MGVEFADLHAHSRFERGCGRETSGLLCSHRLETGPGLRSTFLSHFLATLNFPSRGESDIAQQLTQLDLNSHQKERK